MSNKKVMMKKIYNHNTGLLIMRIGLGSIFLVHGILKLTKMDMTVGFFGQIGLPAGVAWAVALIETVGGALMILGLFTSVVGVLFALIMVGAFVKVKLPVGGMQAFFMGEIDIALFVLSLGVACIGSGKYALSSLCKCGNCVMCKGKNKKVCASTCDSCCDCCK